MGRRACPRVIRGWYVTEAGGRLHKLCPEADGMRRAREELTNYLRARPHGSLVAVGPAGSLFFSLAEIMIGQGVPCGPGRGVSDLFGLYPVVDGLPTNAVSAPLLAPKVRAGQLAPL